MVSNSSTQLTDWRVRLAEPTGQVLFRPCTDDDSLGTSYTRMISLLHSDPDGNHLLATFECFDLHGFPIFESLDGGHTWTSAPVSIVRDVIHSPEDDWNLEWQPDLLELDEAAGNLPASAILFAANAIRTDPATSLVVENEIQCFASTDQGRSWTYLSSLAHSPQGKGGTWEPDFARASDGGLAIFYSSELHKADGYNQLIAHVTSYDGGQTWSSPTFDVAIPDGDARPGMPVVAQLGDGSFVMSYEVCGSENQCAVSLRNSFDGLNWGDATDLGHPVQTMEGNGLLATPFAAWSPVGGPNGTLIVSARDSTETGMARRNLYLNRKRGHGSW